MSFLKSGQIEQATFQYNVIQKSLIVGNSDKYTERELQDKSTTPLLLPSDDGTRWSVSRARILANNIQRAITMAST
jgi:hypothetical protein